MIVRFKDGHKIQFKRFGDIWLAENVIWEHTELHGSLTELRELKADIAKWFDENAPERIHDRFTARLPLWNEVEYLPFKDQIAYKDGRNDLITDYFIGDEDGPVAFRCGVARSVGHLGWFSYRKCYDWAITSAVRLCLEEKE